MVMHSRRWSIRTDRPNLGNGSVWCGRGGWRRCSSGRRIRTDHQCRSALPAAMLALVSKMCALSCLHCLLDSSPIRRRQIRPDAATVASQAQNGPLDPRAANGGPRPRRPRRPACHGLQRPRRRRFRAALLARSLGFADEAIGAPTAFCVVPGATLREFAAVVSYRKGWNALLLLTALVLVAALALTLPRA